MPTEYYHPHVYFVVVFFSLFSFLSNLFFSSSMKDENKNAFTLRFMATSGIKHFLSLFIIVIYAFVNKKQIVPFAILYLFTYFLFTGVETFFLYRKTQVK
jgi:hypothetical protein